MFFVNLCPTLSLQTLTPTVWSWYLYRFACRIICTICHHKHDVCTSLFDYCTFYHTHNPERQISVRLIAVPRGLNPCHEFSVSGTSSNGHVIRSIQSSIPLNTSVKIMMIEFYVAPSTTKDRIAGISEITPVKAPVCLSL